jgi:hypothetical protein
VKAVSRAIYNLAKAVKQQGVVALAAAYLHHHPEVSMGQAVANAIKVIKEEFE